MNAPESPHASGWYLTSVASFMIPAGIQMVMLPYLLAIELQQPAARFGLTQMMGQLPMLLFLLFGGLLADRVDPRRLLVGLHAAAAIMPVALATLLWQGALSEPALVLYALAWGLVTAFALPTRDGLLRRVAGHNVQRMVTLAIGMQFGGQMAGQALGGRAAHWGSISILLAQAALVALGIVAVARLPGGRPARPPAGEPGRRSLWRELGGGLAVIFADAPMRAAFLIALGTGVFFSGVLIVIIPLAIRDLFAGDAQDIAFGFIAFGIGTLLTIVTLTRLGGLTYPIRALAQSMVLGCAALAPMLVALPKWAFYLCVLVWGVGGGIAMVTSRTVLQERAPATHQSRVMALQTLATMGSSPVSALICGFAVSLLGARWALLVPIVGVATVTLGTLATHSIWWQRSESGHDGRVAHPES
ncbi:MAG: MFS transporter [Burkholderiaceae bacterium]|nr:MFS transporter [Burkholderiaceae bacterium]